MYDSLLILCAKRNCPPKGIDFLRHRSWLDRNYPRDLVSKRKSLLGVWSRGGLRFGVYADGKKNIFMTSATVYPLEAKKAVACLRR